MRADDILNQIDDTLHDWTVSDDAMRSRPADEAAKPHLWIAPVDTTPDSDDWQPLGHIRDIDFHIEPPAIDPEFQRSWQEAIDYMRRLQAERARQAAVVLEALNRAITEVVKPAVEQASRTLAQAQDAFRHLPEAVGCNDCGEPAPRRDRPAWQSRYGPAHQRRKRH